MNGGSRGAEELQAGRIDVMHVGLSSVVKLNRAGGDLRLIGSLSNVIRFTFFSAPGVKTAADLKGGVMGVSTFGSESDSTVTLALQAPGARPRRRHPEGIWRRAAAAGGGEVRRDQGHRAQRAVHQPGARAGRQRAGRSRARADPVAVQRHHGAARPLASRRDALTRFLKATDRGQLPGAQRREARQGDPGQGAEDHGSQDPRHQLQRFQAAIAARSRAVAGRAPRTSWRNSRAAAASSKITSTPAFSTSSGRRVSSSRCSRNTASGNAGDDELVSEGP